MTAPRHTLKFPKTVRVRSRLEFAAVYEFGVRVSDGCMTMLALPNERPLTRLGLAVSKRCGNAVRRNQLKRRLREVFRLSRTDLPNSFDLVIQPRADTPIQVAALRQSLISLGRRAAKKWAAQRITAPTDVTTPDAITGAQ